MKTVCLLTLAALVLCPLGQAVAGEKPMPADGALPAANNAFARDLYREVSENNENLFFSPYSVSVALWMTQAGARGDTAVQMAKVLHTASSRGYGVLYRALQPPMVGRDHPGDKRKEPAYRLNIANALWGQAGYPFSERFLGVLKTGFVAPLQRIDFTQTAAARKAINDWVAKNTRDKIRNIVPDGLPPPETRLTLANAIHFKANWKDSFSERGTKDGDFTLHAGERVKAKLMHKIHRYRYADLGSAHAVELPYKGDAMSMVVMLPKNGTIANLDRAYFTGQLEGWEAKLAYRRVDLKLPKFEFTWSGDLTKTLSDMGMPLAFDGDKADFSGMTDAEKLWIGAVLHKAFVAVDEEGTEAAAATVVMMLGRAAPPSAKPVVVHCDRPFLFLIRHRATGTILFMGRVMDPTM